jgi:hypothetical protein
MLQIIKINNKNIKNIHARRMAKNFKLIKGVEATPLQKLNESQELKNPNKYVY